MKKLINLLVACAVFFAGCTSGNLTWTPTAKQWAAMTPEERNIWRLNEQLARQQKQAAWLGVFQTLQDYGGQQQIQANQNATYINSQLQQFSQRQQNNWQKQFTIPLFNSEGQTKYFLDKNDRITGLNGRSVAWIDSDGNVYNYQGEHQGWFEDGHIRGHDGGVITWQQGAQNLGVISPIPQVPPIPPIPKIEPIRPIPSIPPIKPIPSLNWSRDRLEYNN